jgi:hypothetical protein
MTPTPGPDRAAYEAQQAELLRALIRGDDYPQTFDAAKADAAGQSLRRKRARAVAKTWPGLSASLGDAFTPRFDDYARGVPAPAWGGGLTDGLGFARRLPAADLHDEIRVELLFARADIVPGRRGRPPRKRRGVFAAALLLHNPRRILIALRIPGLRPRNTVIALTRSPS